MQTKKSNNITVHITVAVILNNDSFIGNKWEKSFLHKSCDKMVILMKCTERVYIILMTTEKLGNV